MERQRGEGLGIPAFTETVNRTTLVERSSATVPQVADLARRARTSTTVRPVRRQCDLLVVLLQLGRRVRPGAEPGAAAAGGDAVQRGRPRAAAAHSHTLQEVRRLEGRGRGDVRGGLSGWGNFLANQGLKYRVGLGESRTRTGRRGSRTRGTRRCCG
ncbi:MAG: hypothetical protein MZV63_56560 [Marinilabiliales bacterium]|nr:hypothetical protein [Marinilabiliales bacterium]